MINCSRVVEARKIREGLARAFASCEKKLSDHQMLIRGIHIE
jgi:hypothetical protein